MLPEIDFTVYKDKTQVKGFRFRKDDGTYYDFTDSVVNLNIYFSGPDDNPEVIIGDIDITTGYVSFTLQDTLLSSIGNFEYFVIEVKDTGEETPISMGNIVVKDFVPFSTSIEAYLISELPVGFVIDENFFNQKVRYWRLFLQEAFDISTSNVFNDNKWPELVNILIAKIIAYETLIMGIKSNLLNVFSPTSATAGDVKSIETGPSKVEFYAAGETMSQIIKNASSSDANIITLLAEDLCGLARKLAVKIPMCKATNVVKVFEFYKNPDLSRTIAEELDYNKPVSRG